MRECGHHRRIAAHARERSRARAPIDPQSSRCCCRRSGLRVDDRLCGHTPQWSAGLDCQCDRRIDLVSGESRIWRSRVAVPHPSAAAIEHLFAVAAHDRNVAGRQSDGHRNAIHRGGTRFGGRLRTVFSALISSRPPGSWDRETVCCTCRPRSSARRCLR